LASYTGIAARNIKGMTLHASLGLSRVDKGAKDEVQLNKNAKVAFWEGVDYIIIDEVSMVSCSLLYDISKALSDAKGNPSPFGGINVIFAGVFTQLQPVDGVKVGLLNLTSGLRRNW
jgi:hypothetical protein